MLAPKNKMTMANDDSSVSSDDDDFMSPFASLRATFPTPKCESETLVASKDSSFIGARMSPVVFDDDDDRNEDRAFIAPFHRALHEPPIHSSFSNERTSLLGRRSVSRPTRTLVDEENVDNRQGQAPMTTLYRTTRHVRNRPQEDGHGGWLYVQYLESIWPLWHYTISMFGTCPIDWETIDKRTLRGVFHCCRHRPALLLDSVR
jgi:hypothetical protein